MNTVSYKRKVHFYETDAQGIVHHSNYPRYFEEARGYFLDSKGFPYTKIRNELGIDIVLLELSIEYRKFLEYGDEFEIKITIVPNNRYYFYFKYAVIKSKNIISIGKTKHCCIKGEDKKLVSIPNVVINMML